MSGDKIEVQPHEELRCGAKNRQGRPCRRWPATGRRRCRLHGGAEGVGAPRGNDNRLVHGRYTVEAIEERREVRELLRLAYAILAGEISASRTGTSRRGTAFSDEREPSSQ